MDKKIPAKEQKCRHYHQVKSLFKNDTSSKTISTTFTPLQIASIYGFPAADGTGQKIGIIELGGGYREQDIQRYFTFLGIAASPNVTWVGIDGATNNPSDTSGANYEVCLDIDIIASLVPKALTVVYFAQNTMQSFLNAINRAVHEGCTVVSISWGLPEIFVDSQTANSFNNAFNVPNVTFFVASGDNGSSDGTQSNSVDFPACCPFAMGCGGTTLTANGISIVSEVAWSNTGGGLSTFFSKPLYQNTVTYPLQGKRGVPDVCGNADPNTGYVITVYDSGTVDNYVVGGTSAVAPLWAALTAKINQLTGKNNGFLSPTLYPSSACRDITVGSNGAYTCAQRYDPVTGIGSPNGSALLALFRGSNPAPVTITPTFTSTPVSGSSPLTVQFKDTTAISPAVTSWSWNFGDATIATTKNPSHIYTTAGTYSVALAVSNLNGSGILTKTNLITVSAPAALAAAFTSNITRGFKPLIITFYDQSIGSESRKWSFGDGETSTDKNPVHIYRSRGQFTVTLTAFGSGGRYSTTSKRNYILTF